MSDRSRRSFLGGLAALPAAGCAQWFTDPVGSSPSSSSAAGRPVVIASGNGWWPEPGRKSAVETAMRVIRDPARMAKRYGLLEAVVEGLAVQEDDPTDHSVGLGGLPNEDGVVQLDASVMYGPTHQAGAVGALENIQNPARVAMDVLRYTDHSFLVGKGAYDFARAMGLPHTELLTEEARQIWLYWRQKHSGNDDWLTPPDDEVPQAIRDQVTWGTIHVSAVAPDGSIACGTTTSGLSWKIPGRLGDSPICGAGMYCDDDVGTAGATGRGEEAIVNCGAFSVVDHMRRGLEPQEACLELLKRLASNAKKRGLFKDGKPTFNISFYAARKDGKYGSACLIEGNEFAVIDGDAPTGRREKCGWLYDK